MTTYSITLRPTDEVGEDGWQCLLTGRDIDVSMLAQSEELIREAITSAIPTEITFNKLVWVSEFRCVCVLFACFSVHSTSISFRPNIRMVNKFSEGRVFVAGGA